MPFEIDPIVVAPSSADHTDPRPPKRLVPAMTGPAMAKSSRSLPPVDWSTASSREAASTPPIAAIAPEMANTMTRMRLVWIPARRAASALPPTVNTWRPKSVRVATYCIPATKAVRIMTASETPRSGHRPIVEFCLTSVVGPEWTVWSTSTGVARRWPAR
jgi:hypothetical protein